MAISHITAQAMKYPDEQIEAEAVLYLEIADGEIVFAQNFHELEAVRAVPSPDQRGIMSDNYDFIVIGAGAGGSAVANRLSENPDVKVLLLEAGTGEIPEAVRIPAAWPTLWGTPIDWGYNSTPQDALGGRQVYEPRGKVVGGSSDFYIMMHIRGHVSDYRQLGVQRCARLGIRRRAAVLQEARKIRKTTPAHGRGTAARSA